MKTTPSPPPKKTATLHTLGCRLNSSETAIIAQGFVNRGYQLVPWGQVADVVFINTCTVTNQADATCRNLIRKAHRYAPQAKIVVAGCYAQMAAQQIHGLPGVALVVGTQARHQLFHYLDHLDMTQPAPIHTTQSHQFFSAHTTPADHHTRAFLKIQDGCNYICSFCIIPFARGRSRSLDIPQALQQAQHLAHQGFKEIVLTGVNIGEYTDSHGKSLPSLLAQLAQIPGIQRIRLSSIEPNTVTPELLQTLANSPKFLPHFHLPLQSGNDHILQAMRRKYTTATYRQAINSLKQLFPQAGIGADVIVGFPGESELQFQQTVELIEQLPLTHLHVFPYSKRAKTTAAKLPDHLPQTTKKHRTQTLLSLGQRKLQAFAQQQIGHPTPVLFEQTSPDPQGRKLWQGYSPNFVRISLATNKNMKNQILNVIPTAPWGEGGLLARE